MATNRSFRQSLSLDAIIDEALALVDSEGMGRLSMRRLGGRLGVEAMTLYHYVPNKGALVDLLLGRIVIAAASEGVETPAWAEWLSGFAVRYRTALLQHPALVPLVAVRPIRSVAALKQLEAAVAALLEAEFSPTQALHLLNVVGMFVIGHVLAEIGRSPDSLSTPPTEEADAILGYESSRGRQHDAIFDFGIKAILDGAAELTTKPK